MEQMGFFERMKNLFEIIFSSPLFIAILIIFSLTLVLLIINVKAQSKRTKIITSSLYCIILVLVFLQYIIPIFSIGDSIVDKLFTAMYFPSFVTYICMMVISVLLFVIVLFSKSLSNFGKYGSILSFGAIGFLFVLVLETLISNNIDISMKTQIYNNEVLVVLIQSSTICFGIWLLILLIHSIVDIIDKKQKEAARKIFDKVRKKTLIEEKHQKKNEISEFLDEPKKMSNEDFDKSIKNYKRRMSYKDFIDGNKQ